MKRVNSIVKNACTFWHPLGRGTVKVQDALTVNVIWLPRYSSKEQTLRAHVQEVKSMKDGRRWNIYVPQEGHNVTVNVPVSCVKEAVRRWRESE